MSDKFFHDIFRDISKAFVTFAFSPRYAPSQKLCLSYFLPCFFKYSTPFLVKRYFCKRLLGLSGMVNSTNESDRSFFRTILSWPETLFCPNRSDKIETGKESS